jgi:hypothetical protein
MIVGGYALAFHGAPRYTGDIDIFVLADKDNASKILKALDAFGFGNSGLTHEDFSLPDKVVQLGVPPARVDFLTSISGVSWNEADSEKTVGVYGNVPVFYIGLRQFVNNKRAIGRMKDLADLEALGKTTC